MQKEKFFRSFFVRQMSQKYNGMSIIMVIFSWIKQKENWAYARLFFIDGFADINIIEVFSCFRDFIQVETLIVVS